MKIMVVSTPVFAVGAGGLSGYGGLEQIAWLTAKGLAEKGHDVTLIAPEGSQCPGATVIPTGPAGTWDERRAFEMYREELPRQQVVFDHSWSKISYLEKANDRLPHTVICGIMHAPVNTMYQSLPPIPKPSFICISKDQSMHFEALFSRPARVAYNGVDTDIYKPVAGLSRSARFLFLARFSSIKGADLCQYLCRITGKNLDLVGDTSITNEPEYYNLCKSKADGKQIKIVGPASRGECVWWMGRSHAFLHLNQRFREPFGLAPVEAQSCGNPVLCWDFGAMRETVKHKETGYLVKSMEEAKSVMMSGVFDEITDATRARCREWASQFSIENMIARYEQLCYEAVETGGW